MADKSVPFPKEFLPHPADPVLPSKLRIRLFDKYIYMRDAACNQPSSDEEKTRLLFHHQVLEGIRIFSAQPMVAIGGQCVVHNDARKRSLVNTRQPDTLICINYGRRGHRAKDATFPTLNQTCSLCRKLGNFKRVCRSGPAAKPAPKQLIRGREPFTTTSALCRPTFFSKQCISSAVSISYPSLPRKICVHEFQVLLKQSTGAISLTSNYCLTLFSVTLTLSSPKLKQSFL
ncbi:hypothetical protein PoB_000437000 [Plakobranchus ocellatus]|uniref:Uncharacterized protein n=1 Tax=Plakobranchus ocellatus TaxID=259542 RepID=A0AAV3Y4Z4_9GAST|nr:hypothetical protein PoB_000437000 [Plakobranchus ocellatus]